MKLTEEQKAEAVALFVGGQKLWEIAGRFETNIHTIRFACIDALGDEQYRRIAGKHRNRDDKKSLTHKAFVERNQRLIAEYNRGVPVVELAVKYELGVRQVYKLVGAKPYALAKVRVLDKNFFKLQK